MASRYFRFFRLNPTSTLQLLVRFVNEQPQSMRLLDEIQIVIKSPERVGERASVDLYIQDRYSDKRNKKWWVPAFTAFNQLYIELTKVKSPGSTTNSQGFLPLKDGLFGLVPASHTLEPREQATPDLKQKMLIARATEASFYNDLRMFTTAVRFAPAVTPATLGSQQLILYHLVDDVARFSAFEGAYDGGRFGDSSLLTAFSVRHKDESYLLFMHEGIRPNRAALGCFCELILSYPAFIGAAEEIAESEILVAFDRNRYMPVWGLRFQTPGELTPTLEQDTEFEVVQLANSSAAQKTLSNALNEDSEYELHRYRLELRPSRYREVNQAEYERLLLIQAEIGERLAELDSFRVARPQLLRFSQTQLPALADVIRSYPVNELQRILYVFQGTTDRFSEGVHYLFIPPDAAMTELNPLVYWEGLQDAPARFWLDPHWARFYNRYQTKALVFTPKSTHLYPSMHSWGIDTMDDYLRDILGPRFHGEHGVARLPKRPVYVFDGSATPKSQIYLSILDYEKFEPLTVRLGWLNQNLSLLDAFGLEEYVTRVGDDVQRMRLAETVEEQAQLSVARFEQTTEQINADFAELTSDLTTHLTSSFDTLLTRAVTFAEEAQELNVRLQEIEALYQEMNTLAIHTQELIDQTGATAVQDLTGHTGQLVANVERAITHAETTRSYLDKMIADSIEVMRVTRNRLNARLVSFMEPSGQYPYNPRIDQMNRVQQPPLPEMPTANAPYLPTELSDYLAEIGRASEPEQSTDINDQPLIDIDITSDISNEQFAKGSTSMEEQDDV